MKKLARMLVCIAVFCAMPRMANAQDSAAPQESASTPTPTSLNRPAERYNTRATPVIEISGGYSYRAYSPTPQITMKLNGGYLSADYNIFSWLGVAAEGSAAVRKEGARSLGTAQTLSIFSALAGPQVYPLHHRRLTLFTHILIGDGYYYSKAPAFGGFSANVTTKGGFAWEVGGGLDVRIKKHWSIRLAQGDYGETSFTLPTANAHQVGYRLSAGIVYLIGTK